MHPVGITRLSNEIVIFRFSRKERASVSMAIIYLSILTNAMFYDKRPKQVVDAFFSLSFLRVDMVDVTIGFISNIMIFPPVILCMVLFRKCKTFSRRVNRIDKGIALGKSTSL